MAAAGMLCILVTFGAGAASQQPATSQKSQVTTYTTLPIDMDVRPEPLQLVPADNGKRYIAYTLLVTNWGEEDLRFARVDVEEAASGLVLVNYDKAALEDPYRQRSTRLFSREASPENRILRSGRTALLTIAVPLEEKARRPAGVRHRVYFEPDPGIRLIRDDGSFSNELISVSEPSIVESTAPVLGAPLRGGPWRCGNGLGLRSDHNYFSLSRAARLRVAQRFGCDFLKVDRHGNILPNPFPNEITASMFYGYGEDVLAVANARVVEVRDGIPEGVPQADGSVRMPVPYTEDTGPGNRVVLDLGRGRWAFYGHFQPGSILVRRGERVREGQLLGKLGMAGNATNPHLHFHVGNTPSFNGTDGMPYVFRSYTLNGRGKPGAPPQRIAGAVPLQDSVMTFSEPGRRR
jgi:hypothetical protein